MITKTTHGRGGGNVKCAEGQKNLAHLGPILFEPKINTRIGCWNVLTLGKPTKQNGRLRDLMRTMAEKKIQLLALSEVRWPGHGVFQIGNSTFVYSGVPEHEKSYHRKGVAIALSADADAAWRAAGSDFDPVSECLLRIRLKMHSGHVSIIAVYAPTNETSKEDESEQFYLDLQELVCKVPKRDMLLIMGDFNARVGNDVEAWHRTIGRFSPHDKNDNGERLLDFCAFNNLVVTNTIFQHRPCHQLTWFHPVEKDGRGHMMDYVLVNRPFRTSILDTRVYRKTFLQSDHMLVVVM